MKNAFLTIAFILLGSHCLTAQEIIPFPDLSDHHDYSKNGGSAEDERNYAIYTDEYQVLLQELDNQTDRIIAMRKEESDQKIIDDYNEQLDVIRQKKIAVLSEADLLQDLQKFY